MTLYSQLFKALDCRFTCRIKTSAQLFMSLYLLHYTNNDPLGTLEILSTLIQAPNLLVQTHKNVASFCLNDTKSENRLQ